jgi:hypothetical protein
MDAASGGKEEQSPRKEGGRVIIGVSVVTPFAVLSWKLR